MRTRPKPYAEVLLDKVLDNLHVPNVAPWEIQPALVRMRPAMLAALVAADLPRLSVSSWSQRWVDAAWGVATAPSDVPGQDARGLAGADRALPTKPPRVVVVEHVSALRTVYGVSVMSTYWPERLRHRMEEEGAHFPILVRVEAPLQPGRVTGVNLYAMGRALRDGRGSIPNRVDAGSAEHIKRCLRAGLLEPRGNRFYPTVAGIAALLEAGEVVDARAATVTA